MPYVLITHTLCGPGVTLGDKAAPYIYDTKEEADLDLEEADDTGEMEVVPVVQSPQGDWFDGYDRNWSEVARRQ